MLIVWFQNGWDDQYVEAGGPGSPNFHKSNALKTMRQRPELRGTLLAKGGWDYQLVDELVPEASDIVLPKPRYSGFSIPARQPAAQPGYSSSGLYGHCHQRVRGVDPARRLFPRVFWGGAGGCHPSGRAGFCPESRPVQYRNLFGWVSNVNDFCDALDPRSPVSPEENRYAEIRDYSAGHHSDCPFVPGTLADGVVYVSGTLPFDKDNNVVFINDPRGKPATCWRRSKP